MQKAIWYPSIEDIKRANKEVLGIYKATKAEKYGNLAGGEIKLKRVISNAKRIEGDIEDKASLLMEGINLAHAFESANRRTGYFIANMFISKNKGYLLAKKRAKQAEISKKIRDGEIERKDVANWLRD